VCRSHSLEELSRFDTISYFGTADTRQIEKRIAGRDEEAKLIYEAMALNTAKNIAKLSVDVNGNIDYIVLTGGIAHSKLFTDLIISRVRFIAPVEILPGENEMKALYEGALRVLRGEEQAHEFQ
jgi:butyrate kinase